MSAGGFLPQRQPVLLLPDPASSYVNNVKLRPGVRPLLSFNSHWDVQNQGAYPEAKNDTADVIFSPNEQPVSVSSNRITATGGLPQFSASIDSARGLWHGSFQAGAGGPKLSFSGALLPSENLGVGVFIGNQQTGKITLESAVP